MYARKNNLYVCPEPKAPKVDPLAREDAALGIRQPGTSYVERPKYYPKLKRIAEVPVSAAMLGALSPLLAGIYVISKLKQGGPVIFKFPRVGMDGRKFIIYKFRTMDIHAKEWMAQGVPHEELITPLGKFLRRTHLDELPQLFNVLKGELSFVGPRPFDHDTYQALCREDPHWTNVLRSRPGITCIESIFADLPELADRLRNKLGIPPAPKHRMTNSLPRRYPLDMFYVENESLRLDLTLAWSTLKTLAGRAAEHR